MPNKAIYLITGVLFIAVFIICFAKAQIESDTISNEPFVTVKIISVNAPAGKSKGYLVIKYNNAISTVYLNDYREASLYSPDQLIKLKYNAKYQWFFFPTDSPNGDYFGAFAFLAISLYGFYYYFKLSFQKN